jgi:hypothetical protein
MIKTKTKKATKTVAKTTWTRVEKGIFRYESTGRYRARVSVNGRSMDSPVVNSMNKAKEYRKKFIAMRNK